jgi:hypothetical protein
MGNVTGQERDLDEMETQERKQITKRQEIWAYEIESADKNERKKRYDKRERAIDEREIRVQEREQITKKIVDMAI